MNWLDTGSDDLLDQLQILNGFDNDLARDQTRSHSKDPSQVQPEPHGDRDLRVVDTRREVRYRLPR